jgi:hypothetical protein
MSLSTSAVGGHVSLIGASLTPSGTGLDPLLLTGRGVTLGSISVGSRTNFKGDEPGDSPCTALHPVIDRPFPFAEAKEAYRHFESRRYFEKVVITADRETALRGIAVSAWMLGEREREVSDSSSWSVASADRCAPSATADGPTATRSRCDLRVYHHFSAMFSARRTSSCQR